MNSKFKSLIGHKFGKLIVVDNGYSTIGAYYWKCKCECGNFRFYTRQNILKGTLKSCGCFKRQCKGREHLNWKGVGDIGSSFICKIKCNATRRKIKFSLTPEYLWNVFEKQNYKCFLTRLPITFPISGYDLTHGGGTASLDRIDSNIGYIEGNVQWLHKDVNMMKQQLSQTRFIELCKLISKNQTHV